MPLKDEIHISVLLRVFDEFDEDFVRVIQRTLSISVDESKIEEHTRSEQFDPATTSHILSHDLFLNVLFEDELLLHFQPLQSIFVNDSTGWIEIKRPQEYLNMFQQSRLYQNNATGINPLTDIQDSDFITSSRPTSHEPDKVFHITPKVVNIFDVELCYQNENLHNAHCIRRHLLRSKLQSSNECQISFADVENVISDKLYIDQDHSNTDPFTERVAENTNFHGAANLPTSSALRYFDSTHKGYVRLTKRNSWVIPSECFVHNSIVLVWEMIEHSCAWESNLEPGNEALKYNASSKSLPGPGIKSQYPKPRRKTSVLNPRRKDEHNEHIQNFSAFPQTNVEKESSKISCATRPRRSFSLLMPFHRKPSQSLEDVKEGSLPSHSLQNIKREHQLQVAQVDVNYFFATYPATASETEEARKAIWSARFEKNTAPVVNYKEVQWKKLIRDGIPFVFRRPVWLTLTQARQMLDTRPHYFDVALSQTYHWENLLQRFPDFCPRKTPCFALHDLTQVAKWLTSYGEKIFKLLLGVVAHKFPEIHCAPMLPVALSLLLLFLSPEEALSSIVGMIRVSKLPWRNEAVYYLPVCFTSYTKTLCSFPALVSYKSARTASLFVAHRVDLAHLLHHLLCTMFTTVFPLHYAVHLFDAYLNEGVKVLLRFALTLTVDFAEHLPTCRSVSSLLELAKKKTFAKEYWDTFMTRSYKWKLSRRELLTLEEHQDVEQHSSKVSSSRTCSDYHRDPDSFTSKSASTLWDELRRGVGRLSISNRPEIEGESVILTTPMIWEDLFVLWYDSLGFSCGHTLALAYSTSVHGWSLHTLYARIKTLNESMKKARKKGVVSTLLLLHATPKHTEIRADLNTESKSYDKTENLKSKSASEFSSFPFDSSLPYVPKSPPRVFEKGVRILETTEDATKPSSTERILEPSEHDSNSKKETVPPKTRRVLIGAILPGTFECSLTRSPHNPSLSPARSPLPRPQKPIDTPSPSSPFCLDSPRPIPPEKGSFPEHGLVFTLFPHAQRFVAAEPGVLRCAPQTLSIGKHSSRGTPSPSLHRLPSQDKKDSCGSSRAKDMRRPGEFISQEENDSCRANLTKDNIYPGETEFISQDKDSCGANLVDPAKDMTGPSETPCISQDNRSIKTIFKQELGACSDVNTNIISAVKAQVSGGLPHKEVVETEQPCNSRGVEVSEKGTCYGPALCLAADLHTGTTECCPSFCSPPLVQGCVRNEFHIIQCEVFALYD